MSEVNNVGNGNNAESGGQADNSTEGAERLLVPDGSVEDLLHQLGAEQADVLVSFQDHLSSLTEERELPSGVYLDQLDDDKKAQLLFDKKIKDATERRAAVVDEYTKVTQRGHEKLAERKQALKEDLFDVDASVTLAVTLADDAKLSDLVKAATRSSTGLPLAKALLPTLHDRGLDELSMPLFEAYPALEQSWREWQALPADGILERQLDARNIEQVIPKVSPDQLQVRPRMGSY